MKSSLKAISGRLATRKNSHVLLLYSILLDRIVLASYALQVFMHTMIKLCCCVLGDTCSYDSRASQILELGVSEFCSTVPNSHVKSRVCLRVLSLNEANKMVD